MTPHHPSQAFHCKRITLFATMLLAMNANAEVVPHDALWNQCATEFLATKRPSINMPASAEPNTTIVVADEAEARGAAEKIYTFSGAVTLQRGTQSMQGDTVIYHDAESTAEATGNVQIWQRDLLVTGSAARYFFAHERGTMEQANYFLPDRHARGAAAQVDLDSSSTTTLQNTTYTTCAPGDESWNLHARTLTLDSAQNIGTATHVWVDFKSVPIFYFPYVNFTLSGRKSGFLFPTFGRSTSLGTRVAVPFYWNIAPQRDATLTLQNMTRRGPQLLGEFRYLNARSAGQLDVEYLGHDDVADASRSFVKYEHHWSPSSRWIADANYRYASDKTYFVDFGDRLSSTGIVHLERNARVEYRSDVVGVLAGVVDYQTLDETIASPDRPYRKLPEVTLRVSAPRDHLGLRAVLNADAVRFDRAERVSGTRLHLLPSVTAPFEGVAGFLRPKLGLHHTQYILDRQLPESDDQPALTTPVASIDSGLVFERDMTFGKTAYTHTLEPRAFYLYAPYRNQRSLIVDANGQERVFDTSLNALSYSQLFSENRFSGGDRVGDANQLALALSSRVFDNAGVERVVGSVGRIYYAQDREVTLPGAVVETEARSDIVAELRARPIRDLDITSTLLWDEQTETFSQSTLQMRYMSHARRIVNVGLRQSRDTLGVLTQQETDVSFFWPVATHWNVIGRSNYSVLFHRHKEWLVGVEYDSCCWSFSMVARRYVSNTNEADWADHPDEQNSLMLQLQLKGLSNVGQDIEGLLGSAEHGIAGY